MRIAVNCQLMVKNKMEGLGWFAYETLKRIVTNHPEHDFVFIFAKGIENDYLFADNVTAVNIGPPFFRPLAWLLKYQFLLRQFINKNNFDLYLAPDGWVPAGIKCKVVNVIHDINFEHYPKFSPWSFRNYYKYFFKRWAKRADGIGTVSEYSKHDIVTTYNVDEDKIEVMYNGASPIYDIIPDKIKDEIRKKYTENSPYFIFVGALHPRKNVINLFKAFDSFKATDKQNIKLVIVGERFYWNKATNEVYENLKYKNDVIFTGRLTQEELRDVMASALALTYVSLFEGFGIPIIEAMNCGIPVITSNTTSMPEIAADAAIIVDPYSINEITDAMYKLADKPELCQQLITAGNKRKLDFSWDITAEKLWKLVETVYKK
jgi:glycosyltransferase involved in cell wall biosynthesis